MRGYGYPSHKIGYQKACEMNTNTSASKTEAKGVSKLQWLGRLCKSPASPLPLVGGVVAFLISHAYSQGVVATENREQVDAWVAQVEANGSPLTVQMEDVGENRCEGRLKLMAVRGFDIQLAGSGPTTMAKVAQACQAGGTVLVTFKRAIEAQDNHG